MYHRMYEQLLKLSAEVLKRSQFLEEIRVVLKCDFETSGTIMCNDSLSALKLNAQKCKRFNNG